MCVRERATSRSERRLGGVCESRMVSIVLLQLELAEFSLEVRSDALPPSARLLAGGVKIIGEDPTS